MKRIPILLVSLCVALPALCQENLSIGQSLRDYLAKFPPRYMTEGPATINMPEGKVDFYKYAQRTSDADIKVLIVNDKYPIGVLERIAGKDKILLDMSGNGVLDTDFPTLFVPYWVVADSTATDLKTKKNNLFRYFEAFYQSFQSDTNPYTSGDFSRNIDELVGLLSNNELENRDLVYSLYCYYRLGNSFPKQALEVLRYITLNYNQRFDTIHPLIFLQTVETLMNLGNADGAHQVAIDLVRMYPDCIPGLVYQWQLESDPKDKARYYVELKKMHPNHWIVKQI